jgi:predicted ATPase
MLAVLIQTLAISGYRSLRELMLPLGRLTVITGANGSGKSSLYRALRLLGDAAQNQVVASLAREGGLPSTLWAGPEEIPRSVRLGEHPVQGLARKKTVALKLGFSGETYGYSIELGFPAPGSSLFSLDPEIKRECIWHGGIWRRASALVDRRKRVVSLAGGTADEPLLLTKELHPFDSMLATIADPQRGPEMIAVREAIRGWRFYDGFRTDLTSPVRTPQVGTFTPVLNNEGTDLAAALQTIVEIGDGDALKAAIEDAFPKSRLSIEAHNGRFELQLQQHGLLRPLSVAELSDGTLRFLLLAAALLTPRPPELMVLNEPETSLHPDLLPALARLIAAASARAQIFVVSHAQLLISALEKAGSYKRLHLEKSFGETVVAGMDVTNMPRWEWPPR